MKKEIPIGLSNRHIHLSQDDLDSLFGEGYELTVLKDLSQPGQYAANETVTIIGPKNKIDEVRILGPVRNQTQIEVSRTDGFTLGIKPPFRHSGDLEGSATLLIKGPKGEIEAQESTIIALRHIHLHTSDATLFGLKDKDIVSVRTKGPRAITFEEVLIRVKDSYQLEMHLDLDEGNAAGLRNGDIGEII